MIGLALLSTAEGALTVWMPAHRVASSIHCVLELLSYSQIAVKSLLWVVCSNLNCDIGFPVAPLRLFAIA